MAKHLFIVRHAKSDWSFDVRDYDRPLNPRGFRNAPFMAKRLAAYAERPGQLVSSPAKRAITTAQIFAEHLSMPISDIRQEPRIYGATADTLLEVINGFDSSLESVVFFGHNPGLTLLVNYLSDADIFNLPTSSIVHLRFDEATDWASISGGTGTMVWFSEPGQACD